MFLYLPVEETIYHPDVGTYLSYGIRGYKLCEESCKEVAFLSDVSPDANFVADLAWRFTQYQLYPVHLKDAVLNYL